MVEKLETYINENGFPILRRCFNCKHWDDKAVKEGKEGYCKINPMYFAMTLSQTVYPITKDYYLCEKHTFVKESYLNEVCEKILLKEAIKDKKEVKKVRKFY